MTMRSFGEVGSGRSEVGSKAAIPGLDSFGFRGLDGGHNDCNKLVSLFSQGSQGRRFDHRHGSNHIDPKQRLITLFLGDAELRNKLCRRTSPPGRAIIRSDRGSASNQLIGKSISRTRLRQRLGKFGAAKPKLKGAQFEIRNLRLPPSRFRFHMNPFARSFCMALRSWWSWARPARSLVLVTSNSSMISGMFAARLSTGFVIGQQPSERNR